MFRHVFRALLICSVTLATSQPILAQDDVDVRSELQAIVDAIIEVEGIVGLSVAVYSPDVGLLRSASGDAIGNTPTALTPEHLLYAGSVTKTFVAATVLQLIDEGVLSPDDTLDLFYPDYPNADRITIHQMLGMTSGTFDYFRNAPDNPFIPVLMSDITYLWTPDEIITTAASVGQPAAPGTTHTYSNTDYILLGRIIEMTTSNPLHVELRTRLFDPLGMTSSYLAGVENVPTATAQGYVRDAAFLFGAVEPRVTTREDYVGLEQLSWAAGGLISSPADLAIGMYGLMTGPILPVELRDEMTTRRVLPSESGAIYGYGVEFIETVSGTGIGHSGSLPGYASLTLYIVEHDLSIAVMTNDEAGEVLLPDIVNDLLTVVVNDV